MSELAVQLGHLLSAYEASLVCMEIRDHLLERREALLELGYTEEEAEIAAIQGFGPAPVVAQEYRSRFSALPRPVSEWVYLAPTLGMAALMNGPFESAFVYCVILALIIPAFCRRFPVAGWTVWSRSIHWWDESVTWSAMTLGTYLVGCLFRALLRMRRTRSLPEVSEHA